MDITQRHTPVYVTGNAKEGRDDGTDWTATLVTARAPVWGDFYIKDGKTGGIDNSAWNTGFLDADPLDLPADRSINNHVLVPDTYTTPVPEPGYAAPSRHGAGRCVGLEPDALARAEVRVDRRPPVGTWRAGCEGARPVAFLPLATGKRL
jgi:hypothetical protein